jgi:hypothetical protein
MVHVMALPRIDSSASHNSRVLSLFWPAANPKQLLGLIPEISDTEDFMVFLSHNLHWRSHCCFCPRPFQLAIKYLHPFTDKLWIEPGFDMRQGLEIILFSIVSRSNLGPTQSPNQWVPGALSPEVKCLGVELLMLLTWCFIGIATRVRRWSLSWARRTQSTLSYPISLRPILMFFPHLRLGLSNVLFLCGEGGRYLHQFYLRRKKLSGLSPQANRATAACRRS